MSHKSLTKNILIDNASRSHKCRFNKKHVIAKGDRRLKVTEGRSKAHYCAECAKTFLAEGITKLTTVLREL